MTTETMTLAQILTDAEYSAHHDYALDGSDDAHDIAHEIADGAVPVYYNRIAEVGASDLDLILDEPEIGPAFDGSPTPVNIIAANIYERVFNHVLPILEEIVADLD